MKEAQAELLKSYVAGEEPDHLIHEGLTRARLFYVLILVKIVVRRAPLFQKEWAVTTARMIERASQALHITMEI